MSKEKSEYKPRTNVNIFPFTEHDEMTYLGMIKGLHGDIGKRLERIRDFYSYEDDVILCTAMKTGSHWVFEITSMLIANKTEYNLKESIGQCNIECWMDINTADRLSNPRLLHKHLLPRYSPKKHVDNGFKIIYVNRNPKDRAVSQFNFLRGKSGAPNWSWDEFFNDYVLTDTLFGGWFTYTKDFHTIQQNSNVNILQILYEDVILNPIKETGRIADFLNLNRSDEFIKEVAEKCTFDLLKIYQYDESRQATSDNTSTMYRKGEVGDWKHWFTVAQNETFDQLYRDEMKNYPNVKFIYEV